jgi:hypothetical protein
MQALMIIFNIIKNHNSIKKEKNRLIKLIITKMKL